MDKVTDSIQERLLNVLRGILGFIILIPCLIIAIPVYIFFGKDIAMLIGEFPFSLIFQE